MYVRKIFITICIHNMNSGASISKLMGQFVLRRSVRLCNNTYFVIIPREKGILFSVCLSVCLSGTLFFSFCARNSSYSFHHTQTKPIPSESWMSGVCHGGSVFSYPPKFRRNRSLKTAQIPIFGASQVKEF